MASTSKNLYVTYVDFDRDLLRIWGQRNRIGGTYIERVLMQLLPEFNKTASPNPNRIHKGMFCFAKYTDDNYYRARVISRVQGDSVSVLFVDYGNRDTIKISDIRIQEGNEGDVLVKMSEQAEEYYLARVAAPPLGWTRDIISEIRRDICYDEFHYQIIDQVGDQKILDVQFRDEDFSSYLVKKQLARPLPLLVQREMILSYCSLVSNDVKPDDTFRDTPPRFPFSHSMPPPVSRAPPKPLNMPGEVKMHLNYPKPNNPINFPCPPPPVRYPLPRQMRAPFQQVEPSIPKNSFYHPVAHINNQMPVDPVNPGLTPLLNHQFSQFYPLHDGMDSCINNANNTNNSSNIIELLAQQVKQYIAKDSTKSEAEMEKAPHHYVNSVLEVGNTYNVIISYIDDGPWSFSIQLLSSEMELQKLMDELSNAELIPIKPPIILGYPCIGSSALYGNLCRGVIVSISRSAVKVYFVDFGNTEDLPASSIYELPPKFFKTRVLSQKFSLSGLQKVAYSDDIKKFFKEVVQDGLLVLRVTSLEDDNLPTCELYLKERNIKRILNEKMRELRNSALEDFPKVGDTENVLVTWVVSPLKFFVQLCKRDADLKALKKELEEVGTKGEMMTYQQLSVGTKCVCQYESDGHWYRAVITSVDSEKAISVFYIDYGNSETVSISHLRKVEGSGLINQMGNQAVQCSLKGFENQPFDEEVTKRLEALTLEKEFQMTVASSDKQLLCVNLYDNGRDIASLLPVVKTEPKKKEVETSSYSSGSVWSSSESNSRLGRDTRYQADGMSEQNDRNFRGDQIRLEDRENWKDNRPAFQEKDSSWGGQKFDQQRQWRSRGPREFGDWDLTKGGGSRGPPKGRDESRSRARAAGGRGFGQARNRPDRRANSYTDKKFGENNVHDDREGKRFANNRGWDSFRGGEDSKKKFGDWAEKCDEKPSRVPIKKEDIAPPGSKFEEKTIEIGSCERGIVTYYFSPDEFFVQLLAQEEEFKKMMKDIQVYYSDKYSIRDPVKAGDVVVAQFSHDKILYRAEVIKASPVTVRYIDYGNQEPVQPKGIWFVDKQFLKLPQQVLKCRLSGLQPLGSDWPPPGSAVEKFFEFAEYNCTFLGKEGDMYEISMEALENGKDVAGEIIAAGLGRPPASELSLDIPQTNYSLLQHQVLRLFVCHVESPSKFYVVVNPKASELIAEAISAVSDGKRNLSPVNWAKLEREMPCLATTDGASWYRGNILRTDGDDALVWLSDRGDSLRFPKDKVMHLPDCLKAFRPQAVECRLHGVPLLEDAENFKELVECRSHLVHIASVEGERLSVILYDEEGQLFEFEKEWEVARSIEPIGQLPLISERLEVEVSHLESAKEVYIQRVADEGDLINFLEQINYFCTEEGGENWPADEDIPAGALVAAKSKAYDSWYRGRVRSSGEGGFEVFYIDYGNGELLPRENLKKLDSSFLGMNAFCRAVALDGDFEKEDPDELKRKFWELCGDKDLVGYLRNDGGEFVIDLRVNEERMSDLLKAAGSGSGGEGNRKEAVDGGPGELRVFVSHIDRPGCFWVHKEGIVEDLQRLQDRLDKSWRDLADKTDVEVGEVVAAAFSGTRFRARVLEAEDEKLKVQLIDYGNTATVDRRSEVVKELSADLASVPVLATRFGLRGHWSENCRSKFEEIILRNEDWVSVAVLEEKDPVVVDLFQNGRSVTEMLEEEMMYEVEGHERDLPVVYITHCVSPVEFYVQRESCTGSLKGLIERLSDAPNFEDPPSVEEGELYAAKYPEDETWYRARVLGRSEKGTRVRFVDYGNTSTVAEVKRLPGDLGQVAWLSEKCSLIYGNKCDSWSEAACEAFAEYADGRPLRMKVVLSRGGRTIVRLFHGNKSVSEELESACRKDGRKEMYVTQAASPTDFYIQYVADDEYKCIAKTLKEGVEREDLEKREKGAIVQAHLAEDGCWYRARILKDLGEEGCEVFLIDFGSTVVAKELKKLPAEIKDIPPRALKCTLDLGGTGGGNSAKEEFVNLTAAGAAVFRGRIISPGATNVVSLKLDGRIIEETLDVTPEKSLPNGHENFKAESVPERSEVAMEEIPEESGEVEGGAEESEARARKRSSDPGRALGGAVSQKNLRNKVHKIVPGSICRGEKEGSLKEASKVSFRKLKFSEKVVPGSISRGVSLESMAREQEEEEEEEVGVREEKHVSQSAPNTPRSLRKNEYVKVDVNDRLVPGCISTGIPLHCSPAGEKTARSEKIVPGAVNGNQ